MSDSPPDAAAEAEIDQTFSIRRGCILVLKPAFFGAIPRNGLLQGAKDRVPYVGPDYVDWIAQQKAALAVTVDNAVGAQFTPGQRVRFFDPTAHQRDPR